MYKLPHWIDIPLFQMMLSYIKTSKLDSSSGFDTNLRLLKFADYLQIRTMTIELVEEAILPQTTFSKSISLIDECM